MQVQVYVDSLVKKAYDNWDQVVEYDGKSLLGASDLDQQLPQPALSVTVPTEQQMNSGLPVGGKYCYYAKSCGMDPVALNCCPSLPPTKIKSLFTVKGLGCNCADRVLFMSPFSGYNDTLAIRYSTQPLISNSNTRNQFDSTSYVSHDQLINNAQQRQSTRNDHGLVGLALAPPQSTSGFHAGSSSIQPSTLNPFDEWSQNRDKGVDEFFSEEEIRIRSNEMLENEDMQHLLRLFSMGGHPSMPEDSYSFPPYVTSPMPNFDEDRSRPGKAVVGWLKIKAAMRWGFFIRKKAAERRAQIVELDDE